MSLIVYHSTMHPLVLITCCHYIQTQPSTTVDTMSNTDHVILVVIRIVHLLSVNTQTLNVRRHLPAWVDNVVRVQVLSVGDAAATHTHTHKCSSKIHTNHTAAAGLYSTAALCPTSLPAECMEMTGNSSSVITTPHSASMGSAIDKIWVQTHRGDDVPLTEAYSLWSIQHCNHNWKHTFCRLAQACIY